MAKTYKTKQNITALSLTFREGYTGEALKRSVPIEFGLPNGTFKIMDAFAKGAYKNTTTVPANEVLKYYRKDSKQAKSVESNLAKLTAEAHPLVISKKKLSRDSEKEIVTPLYDVSTGNIVELRYARVMLSELGKLYVEHYQNRQAHNGTYYKSIVPVSLLRRNTPWATGHKSSSYPLNPRELFMLMVKMIEYDTPDIPLTVVNDIFRGFDLGKDYVVYMTNDALSSLYLKGESSFIVAPTVSIDAESGIVTVNAPPYEATSKKLKMDLIQHLEKGEQPFKTFEFNPDLKDLGKAVQLKVRKWKTNNPKEIIQELQTHPLLAKKNFSRHEVIRYDNSVNPESNFKSEADYISVLDVEDLTKLISEEEIDSLGFRKVIDKHRELWVERDEELRNQKEVEDYLKQSGQKEETDILDASIVSLPEEYQEEFDYLVSENLNLLKERAKEKLRTDYTINNYSIQTAESFKQANYKFFIDLVPVKETLWHCISNEVDNIKIEIRGKIAAVNSAIEKNKFLEKVTRPKVATLINSLNLDKEKHQKLFEQCKKGSEILPEGLTWDEVREIYRRNQNEVLANLVYREDYISINEALLSEKAELEDKLNNDALIRKDIASRLTYYINLPELSRKSRARFKTESSKLKKSSYLQKKRKLDIVTEINYKQPVITNHILSIEDMPCTLYINQFTNQVIKGYGMNCYNLPFRAFQELNVLSNEPLLVEYVEPVKGKVVQTIITANDISYKSPMSFGLRLHYIIPFDTTKDHIFWTSQKRYYHTNKKVYGDYPACLNLNDREFVTGWQTTNLDDKGDLYCLVNLTKSTMGVQALDIREFKRFKGIANLWNNLSAVSDIMYVEDFEKDVTDLGLFIINDTDYRKLPDKRVLKPRTSTPVGVRGIVSPYFSKHANIYYRGLYLTGKPLEHLLRKPRKYRPPKYHTIEEMSPISNNLYTTLFWEELLYKYINTEKMNMPYHKWQDLFSITNSRYSDKYLDYDLTPLLKIPNVLDPEYDSLTGKNKNNKIRWEL